MALSSSNLPLVLLVLVKALSVDGQVDPCYLWSNSSYVGLDTCYRVFFDQRPLTFVEAQMLCESHNGVSLAEVRTIQHWEELRRLLVHKNVTHFVWLGGRNTDTDATLRWISDNTTVNVSSTWWRSDLRNGSNIERRACLTLGMSQTLETLPCSDRLEGYVCQRGADNPCPHFLSGAEYFDGNCFMPLREKLTACESRRQCEAQGAKLIEPDTEDLRRFARSFASRYFESHDNITIGSYKTSLSKRFQWITTGKSTEGADWARGEPKQAISGDVIVQMLGSENWQWGVAPQTAKEYTICQKDITKACEGILARGSCLVLHKDPLRWLEGKAKCEMEGYFLVEPKTDQLKAALIRLLENAGVQGSVLTGAAAGLDDEKTGNLQWNYSGEEYAGAQNGDLGNNRLQKFCLVWDTEKQTLVPQDLDNPSQFVCQRDLITYTYKYVATIPRACAEDEQSFHSTSGSSGCPSSTSSTQSFTTTTTTTTTWVALSAAHPDLDGNSNPIHVRLSVSQQSPRSTYLNGNDLGVAKVVTSEETMIHGRDGFYRSFNLTYLILNGSDPQQTYFLVQSTSHISPILMVWREVAGDVTSVCSSLLFPAGWGDVVHTSFFSHTPSSEDVALSAISTSELPNTLNFIASGTNETVNFDLGGYTIEGLSNTRFSTTLAWKYETAHISQMSGPDISLFIQSNNDVSVFASGRDRATNDATLEQILPVSLVGSDYVTFPSLPADQSTDSTDLFSVVAAFNDTLIQVFNYNITMDKAGDVANIDLPATGFHHVTGNKPFYLYARLKAEYNGPTPLNAKYKDTTGMCSVKLLPRELWRSVYTVHISGPLLDMEVYIAMVVLEDGYIDRARVRVWDDANTEYIPTTCRKVKGTGYMGCYLRLPPIRQVCSIGSPTKQPLAAYMFARTHGSATCSQLGVKQNLVTHSAHTEYDASAYMEFLKNIDYCPKSTPLPVILETFTEAPPICSVPNITIEEAETRALKIKEELKIDSKTTSSFQRKKKTVGDFRGSSVSVGVISLVFVSVPFILVILVDIHSLVLFLVKYYKTYYR